MGREALRLVALASVSLCISGFAYAAENCTLNYDRFADVKINLKWCLDPTRHAAGNARHRIIYGRYNDKAALIRDGYGKCQKGMNSYQNYDFCDEYTFMQAAAAELPESDRGKYPEASRDPERHDGYDAYPTGRCFTPSGRNCQSGNLPRNTSCACAGEAGTVR